MPLVSTSIDAFLVTTIATVVPWIYFTIWRTPAAPLTNINKNAQPAGQRPPPPRVPPGVHPNQRLGHAHRRVRTYISLFIALHSVYVLYNLLVCAQQNVFMILGVPLTEPSDAIRARLLYLADVPELPDVLERVLVRLRSFDVRHVYVRFGHNVVAECEHCVTFYDYALYALPRPLLEYVREAAVLGVVTIRGSVRERWRQWGLGVLAGCALLEGYFVLSANVVISKDESTVMLHDRLWMLRQLLFLLLPATLHLLPPTPRRGTPLDTLPELTALANQTFSRIRLLKYTRGAVARAPELREAASEWWAKGRVEGEWVRGDEAVRELAKKLGMGIDEAGEGKGEGELRVKARAAVESLKVAYQPSSFQ